MAQKQEAKKGTKQPAKRSSTKRSNGFSAEERAAMREAVREFRGAGKLDGETELLAKISEMPEPDRTIAERLHEIVKASAPALTSRTWYGMPAYAKEGKVVCYFQTGQKFKSRYGTLGFSDQANLDDGATWPVAFAVTEWNRDVEAKVRALIEAAIS